jgi:hypothetical protein
MPQDSPFLPDVLNNLGIGWIERFNRTGEIRYLDASVDTLKRTVSLLPENSN